MDIASAITSRRSIRKFKDQPVERCLLEELVHAGTCAPSGSNAQPWRFGILTNPEIVKKVDLFSPGLSGHPPAILVLCTDKDYAFKKGGALCRDEMSVIDVSMAAENIMLLALEKGLGTCTVKSFNQAAIKKICQLPEAWNIELLLSIGYPDRSPVMPSRFPLSEITFYDIYSSKTKK